MAGVFTDLFVLSVRAFPNQWSYVIIRPQLGAQNYTNVINHNAYDIDQASSTYDMFIQ
jgi:hypothetical protein